MTSCRLGRKCINCRFVTSGLWRKYNIIPFPVDKKRIYIGNYYCNFDKIKTELE